tara:strand:- start:153 stop:2135 length:1983 start_codon:yes stop_codon:yes gene_type:complete
MAYVYKQFTAQDQALIPFNAHKQYNFNSASASTNSISFYNSRWTSESYDVYSGTASLYSATGSNDSINAIKYNQIDKLYYRNFHSQIHDKLGPIEYIKQPRNLYEKANILSIPMGLYGNQIKPGSFYLKSSTYDIIDDKFGNLLISKSTVDYPNNPQQNVFRLDPIKGFKKYDLGVHDGYATISELQFTDSNGTKNYEKNKWRRGTRIDHNSPTTFTSGQKKPLEIYSLDKDDSYFMNNIHYNNVTFNTSSLGSTSHKFPKIALNSSTGSLISSSHSEKFNFNKNDDFSISFWIKPKGVRTNQGLGSSTIENGFIVENYHTELIDNKKRYIISKSNTKNVPDYYFQDYVTPPEFVTTNISKIVPSETRFPYEIYMQSSSLFFDMSDGNTNKSITTKIEGLYNNNLNYTHILCQNSGSIMQLWKNGVLESSTTLSFKNQTRNTADLYIGSSGNAVIDQSGGIESSSIENGFVIGNYVNSSNNFHRGINGDITNINIWSRAYNSTTITNISESINGSPYIGNIFYQNGFVAITHPSYHHVLNTAGVGTASLGGGNSQSIFQVGNRGIDTLQFQGTHLIYEHEYQCTVGEHEFNDTKNISARKLKSTNTHELADFTTSSLFKPHVTTIGLYDNNMELLVVGKLGQPVRTSDETDTTFVLRWDT